MRRFTRMAGGVLLLTVSAMATGAAVNAMPIHERTEVAGLAIVSQGDVDDITHALNAYAAAITAMDIEAVGEWVTEDLLIFEGAGVGTAVLVKGDDGRWRLRHLHTTPERRRQ